MPGGLIDIGNNFKVVDPASFTGGGAGGGQDGGLNSIVNLLQLQQSMQRAPLEIKKLEIETALKANELLNLDVENLLKQANLQKAYGDEQRAQLKFKMDALKSIPDYYRIDKNLGDQIVQQLNPNATSTINEDGTFTISYPSSETKTIGNETIKIPKKETISFSIDPNKLDPEKRAQLEGQWYDRFTKNPVLENFSLISQQYKNIKDNANLNTGQGDIALIFSYMKMLDPRSVIRENEVATAQNVGNVPEKIWQRYNQALTTSGPFFKKDARDNFIKSAEIFYNNSRESALLFGRDIVDTAKREKLNPRNIITPVGDITEKDFLQTNDSIISGLKSELSKIGNNNATK